MHAWDLVSFVFHHVEHLLLLLFSMFLFNVIIYVGYVQYCQLKLSTCQINGLFTWLTGLNLYQAKNDGKSCLLVNTVRFVTQVKCTFYRANFQNYLIDKKNTNSPKKY